MNQKKLNQQLDLVAKLASGSKITRFLHHPIHYSFAVLFKSFWYPRFKQSRLATASLFYGAKMQVALPSGADIFLTGGKSHISEIHLARLLIRNLKPGDSFIDIGGHYGYFTLLAAAIVGKAGSVHSFEASPKNFKLLKANAKPYSQIHLHNLAMGDHPDQRLTFYEFPNLYSEYNSFDIEQYKDQDWFAGNPPIPREVEMTTLDTFIEQGSFQPKLIKIDVEGAEALVIKGGVNFLKNQEVMLIMEYLAPDRHNEAHQEAVRLLEALGYKSYKIQQDGDLTPLADIEAHLAKQQLVSDNVVFKK